MAALTFDWAEALALQQTGSVRLTLLQHFDGLLAARVLAVAVLALGVGPSGVCELCLWVLEGLVLSRMCSGL